MNRFAQWVALMQLGHSAERAAELVRTGRAAAVIAAALDPKAGN